MGEFRQKMSVISGEILLTTRFFIGHLVAMGCSGSILTVHGFSKWVGASLTFKKKMKKIEDGL